MKETKTYYEVSSFDWSRHDLYHLGGFSTLAEAEQEAKAETKNQAIRQIHRHILEVTKIFKVEDEPKEGNNEDTCKYEKCTKPTVIKGDTGYRELVELCHEHAGLKFALDFKQSLQRDNYTHDRFGFSKMPNTKTRAKALKLTVEFYAKCDGYSSHHERAHDELIEALIKANVVHLEDFEIQVSQMHTVKNLCYLLVKGARE